MRTKQNYLCVISSEAVETINDPVSAIKREKQIKAWRCEKKVSLIDSINPQWNDLSQDWYE